MTWPLDVPSLIAEQSLKMKNRDLSRSALEQALALLLRSGADSIEYEKVGEVLRRLINISSCRAQAKPHFLTLRQLLSSFTAANVPGARVRV